MNLYEIATDYQNILANTFDPETGEINENAIALLEIAKTSVEDKGIAVASYIKNLDAEAKAIEEAERAMTARKKSLERRAEWLTNFLQSNMERCGISEIKSPYFVVKLKKCPVSVNVMDESSLPDEYKKRKEVVTVDKLKLKDELLAGVVVPGVELQQRNRLEIK